MNSVEKSLLIELRKLIMGKKTLQIDGNERFLKSNVNAYVEVF